MDMGDNEGGRDEQRKVEGGWDWEGEREREESIRKTDLYIRCKHTRSR